MTSTALRPDVDRAEVRSVPRRRRRSRLVLVGVLLSILGAVGGVLLVGQVGRREAVVAVARHVPFGQAVAVEDLRSVLLPVDSQLATVSWDHSSDLVGRVAATDLLPGQIVTPDAVVSDRLPAPGSAVVGIAVRPGRLPAATLEPRDHVLVIDAGETAGSGTDAVVLRVDRDAGAAGSTVVDLLLAAVDAPQVARLGAADRAVLVLLSGR